MKGTLGYPQLTQSPVETQNTIWMFYSDMNEDADLPMFHTDQLFFKYLTYSSCV